MEAQITDHPPFEVPQPLRKVRRWAERKVPDYSDGDMRHWPGGQPYRPSADAYYRCVLGQAWADQDGTAQQGVQYYVDKLPAGYSMFEINQPSGSQVYRRLFGHPSGRFFDSAARFVPHFLWLMSGMDGNCECVYCSTSQRPLVPRQKRAPRETIDVSMFNTQMNLIDSTDDDIEMILSGTGGLATKRTQRQVRQAGAPHAVDEEGTEDVYKDCVRKLENAKGSTRGVEIDVTEDGSIDWKADRASLPQQFTQIEQQHSFIPRIGELVLWCPTFLDQHYLMIDPETSEYKFYSFDQKCFHGFPAWRGGVVSAVPSANVKNGTVDFPDILETPQKKTSMNTAGFRIETMPDPNDDIDKSMSKQYRYVPLRHIRPLVHWQMLLKGIAESKLHPSVSHALTCMTSISLLERWKFNGSWPAASIFCKGIYLGPELIISGDAIRLLPSSAADDLQPDIMIVDSIRYNLLEMRSEHARPDTAALCSKSYISFVGSAYTTSLSKAMKFNSANAADKASRPQPLSKSELKLLFPLVGAEEYGQWYRCHSLRQKYEVSHEKVVGRLYEADAIKLWTGQRQIEGEDKKKIYPDINFDVDSVIAGRLYATATDARLPEPQSEKTINWFLADTRADALAVATVNGMDVGKYHDVRTATTLKQWRTQVKVADGQSVAPGVADQYINDLTALQFGYTGARRGRPPGSKLVNGKLVMPGQTSTQNRGGDSEEDRPKPSSQMAGAALATDYDDSSDEEEEHSSDEMEDEATEVPAQTMSVHGKKSAIHSKSTLSKADIMNSVEVPDDGTFDADGSDEEQWWQVPPVLRGGTEESDGGDYRD